MCICFTFNFELSFSSKIETFKVPGWYFYFMERKCWRIATIYGIFNNYTSFIIFTHQWNYNSIHFLDITVTKNINANRYESNICRKDTFSDNYLHSDSQHPLWQKRNTVKGQLITLSRLVLDDLTSDHSNWTRQTGKTTNMTRKVLLQDAIQNPPLTKQRSAPSSKLCEPHQTPNPNCVNFIRYHVQIVWTSSDTCPNCVNFIRYLMKFTQSGQKRQSLPEQQSILDYILQQHLSDLTFET